MKQREHHYHVKAGILRAIEKSCGLAIIPTKCRSRPGKVDYQRQHIAIFGPGAAVKLIHAGTIVINRGDSSTHTRGDQTKVSGITANVEARQWSRSGQHL